MSKKFLKIDPSEVKRISFLANNSMYFCDNNDLLSDIFKKHEIPEEYQKVYFYKSLLNDCLIEFFTDVSFDLEKSRLGGIKARLKKKNNYRGLDFNAYFIDTSEINCSKKEIMNFYHSLYEKGYLRNYLIVLSEFFILNLDLYYIMKLSESNYSVSKQKRLYRQRMFEKQFK